MVVSISCDIPALSISDSMLSNFFGHLAEPKIDLLLNFIAILWQSLGFLYESDKRTIHWEKAEQLACTAKCDSCRAVKSTDLATKSVLKF